MNNWMMTLIAIFTMGIFTSCEEDNKIAFRLDGEWRGDFGMNYTIERNGRLYTFDSFDTYLVFYNDGVMYSTHGWGKQVDYYDYGPYAYQYYRFYWRIRDGKIYLDYPYDPELNTVIYDYRISFGHFTGWFDNSDVRFDLRKLDDTSYDWEYYRGDYIYGYNNAWSWGGYYPYYVKTRSNENAGNKNIDKKADTADYGVVERGSSEDKNFTVVKRGNRFINPVEE